jgi:Flp pilus assembly pilin Flp
MNRVLLELYRKTRSLQSDEEGQDLLEYGMLLCIITLSLISALQGIASTVVTVFTKISSSLV